MASGVLLLPRNPVLLVAQPTRRFHAVFVYPRRFIVMELLAISAHHDVQIAPILSGLADLPLSEDLLQGVSMARPTSIV